MSKNISCLSKYETWSFETFGSHDFHRDIHGNIFNEESLPENVINVILISKKLKSYYVIKNQIVVENFASRARKVLGICLCTLLGFFWASMPFVGWSHYSLGKFFSLNFKFCSSTSSSLPMHTQKRINQNGKFDLLKNSLKM